MASLSKQTKRSRFSRLLLIRATKRSEKRVKSNKDNENADLAPFYGNNSRERLDMDAMSYLLSTGPLVRLADFIHMPKNEPEENAGRKQRLRETIREINRLIGQN